MNVSSIINQLHQNNLYFFKRSSTAPSGCFRLCICKKIKNKKKIVSPFPLSDSTKYIL